MCLKVGKEKCNLVPWKKKKDKRFINLRWQLKTYSVLTNPTFYIFLDRFIEKFLICEGEHYSSAGF